MKSILIHTESAGMVYSPGTWTVGAPVKLMLLSRDGKVIPIGFGRLIRLGSMVMVPNIVQDDNLYKWDPHVGRS